MRPTGRRTLLALLVLAGLFAMHAITAPSASAETACGQSPAHVHPRSLDAPPARDTVSFSILGSAGAGHLGLLCLAMVVTGLAVALTRRRTDVTDETFVPESRLLRCLAAGRGPPGLSLHLLCVCRN